MINRLTIEAAAAHCLSLEDHDHCEHGVALDANGNTIFVAQGDKRSVDFTKYVDSGLLKDAHTVVHNHPTRDKEFGGSLSGMDMMFARTHGVEIWAVSKSGSRYWSSGFLDKETEDEDQNMLGADQYETLGSIIARDLSRAVQYGKMTEHEFHQIIAHVVNLASRQAGIIDYHWDLDPVTQQIVDKHLEFINSKVENGDIYKMQSPELIAERKAKFKEALEKSNPLQDLFAALVDPSRDPKNSFIDMFSKMMVDRVKHMKESVS